MSKLIKKTLLSVVLVMLMALNFNVFNVSLLNEDTTLIKATFFSIAYFLLVYGSLMLLKQLMILSIDKNKMYTYIFAATSVLSPIIVFNLLNENFGVNVGPLGLIVAIAIIAVTYFNFELGLIKKKA